MGAHLLVTASTLFLQLPQQDSTPQTEQASAGIAYDRLSDTLRDDRMEGLSVVRGLIRFEPSRPIAPESSDRLRFDLVPGRLE